MERVAGKAGRKITLRIGIHSCPVRHVSSYLHKAVSVYIHFRELVE